MIKQLDAVFHEQFVAEVWSAGSKDEEVQLKHFKVIASEKEKGVQTEEGIDGTALKPASLELTSTEIPTSHPTWELQVTTFSLIPNQG